MVSQTITLRSPEVTATVTAQVPARTPASQPILAHFRIQNLGTNDLSILLNDPVNALGLRVQNGPDHYATVTAEGRMLGADRAPVPVGAFMCGCEYWLVPGTSWRWELDLRKYYELPPGTYMLSLEPKLNLPRNETSIPLGGLKFQVMQPSP